MTSTERVVDLTPDHRLDYCTLPPKRRRWLGLVAACAVCGQLFALRAQHRPGTLFTSLRWQSLAEGWRSQ